ncbi:Nuclear cap-binding protein subunit 1-A [Fasciola gigantica]|uniref:Nuclear cap-binding protein subunit 1-A n=1 Tax=Fasciola gigantica TaxID=46835 RepID=A0A504YZL9_FASGI|nr:Nuclear cap-binding protein subunit 1-A [Fasciola gigantica]
MEIPRNGDKILRSLNKCVKYIPERMLIYATMLGLINVKNRAFVNQFIEMLHRELKDSIKSAAFEDAKYLILFLSASINCNIVTPSSILGLYENLAEVTLDAGRSSQSRTDWYTYVILYSLPYSAHMLSAHDASTLNDILGTIDVYMTKRQKTHVPLLRVLESDDPHPQEETDAGQPHHLPPITPPEYDTEVVYPVPRVIFRMFDYTDVIDQDDDNVVTAADGSPKPKESPVLPGAHTIERFLIDEQLSILMNNLNFNRVLCAQAMLGLRTRARVALDYMIIEAVFAGMFNLPTPPVRHGNLLFYGSLLIQLCQEATNTMPLVLAQATEVLYERLNTMKPVCIGRMIEWFSYHLSNYQFQWSWREWSSAIEEDPMSPHRRLITETFARLIRFSYFENVKRLLPKPFYPLLPPQPIVVNKYDTKRDLPSASAFYQILEAIRTRCPASDVLKMVQRASDPRRVSSPDNKDDRAQVDASDDENPEQQNRKLNDDPLTSDSDLDVPETFTNSNTLKARPQITARRRLLRADTGRGTSVDHIPAEDKEILDDERLAHINPESRITDLSHGVTNLSVELLFSALLIAGHKTISHTFAFIRKYTGVIRTIASTVETQVEALHVLQAVWASHPQMIVIITEHMCRSGLLDPEAIVRWAYSPIMTSLTEIPMGYNPSGARPRILDFYVWECLSRTLLRVGRRVTRITSRLEAAKEMLELDRDRSGSSSPGNPNGARDDDDEDEDNLYNNGHHRNDRNSRSHLGACAHNRRSKSRSNRRNLMAGCELVSSEDELNQDEYDDEEGDVAVLGFGSKGPSGSRVARLEEARCEAVRSQCAVITLLLHRHARLTSEVASALVDDQEILGAGSGPGAGFPYSSRSTALLHDAGQHLGLSKQALQHVAFWLKGRLVQVVLEHCDQLAPYLDNLDELICGSHPEVQDVFQQLRSLHA